MPYRKLCDTIFTLYDILITRNRIIIFRKSSSPLYRVRSVRINSSMYQLLAWQHDQTYERERKNLIEEDEEGAIREGETEEADKDVEEVDNEDDEGDNEGICVVDNIQDE